MNLQVDQADALVWLGEQPGGSVVAMLPDAEEVGMTLTQWRPWFSEALEACFAASTGPTVFAQTDRKHRGRWISKAQLAMDVAAEMPGVHLLWHRVALRRDAGKTDIHRPGYTHVLAFGPGKPGKAHPDVLPPGARTWKNGVAYNVATMVAEYLAGQGATTMLNPFCGEGTFLRAAVSAGLLARGCDLDPDRVATAMAQATLL